MEDVLQRWRCPDCRSVFDVFVDADTGHADDMKDELCPTCNHGGKTVLGRLDEHETALYASGKDPCVRCGSREWRQRTVRDCTDCRGGAA